MSTENNSAPFPGIPGTSDGAGGVVWVETNITQGTCAYPITSSTTMGSGYETEVANGKHNLWGDKLVFIQPESEHSAATSCEGFALAGGRVTNFTSGQGLVLMKEVLYTISGKRLPVVFHIGARALTSHSLNVHYVLDRVRSEKAILHIHERRLARLRRAPRNEGEVASFLRVATEQNSPTAIRDAHHIVVPAMDVERMRR